MTAVRHPRVMTAPSTTGRRRGVIEAAAEQLRGANLPGSARTWLKGLYHRALMLQTGGRGLRAETPEGEVVRVLPAHRQLAWNPDEYAAFRAAITPGMVALDVGANVGAYALLLAQWVGRSGLVYAFEPAGSLYEGLVQHLRLNGVATQVTPVLAAVGDREGVADLILSETAGESRLASLTDARTRTMSVPIVTLDGFCVRERITPDFIKIDVEGWELAVLRGAADTIRKARGRLALFVELHPSVWPELGITRDDVVRQIDCLGLDVVPLADADPWSVEGLSVKLQPR